MASDKKTAISAIGDYVAKVGGSYSHRYVGITANAKQRLFNDHAVDKDSDAWIYHQCTSSNTARAVEDYFLALGMKGGSGGGDDDSDYVYAYKISDHSVE